MNLALAWLWKEWHAQWRLLAAYLGLSVASIAIVCALLPYEHWRPDAVGVSALAWFVAVGVAGVVLFAAPQLVRGEFAPKDDQFVRRLPGALLPACAGKLLFLTLLSLGMPLLALLLGEGMLWAMGLPWRDLFVVRGHDPQVIALWPTVGVAAAAALLLAPWVAAIGMWLPGGRMAVGGTVLLLLVLGFVLFAVLGACRGLEQTIAWQPWLWYVWPAGAALFAVSWRGRRGGGHARSAAHGLTALAAIIAIPGGVLGHEVWRYRHPDPQCLHLRAPGLSPDGRVAVAYGRGHAAWMAEAPFRIDLTTGNATQLLPVRAGLFPATLGPLSPSHEAVPRRWWRTFADGDIDQVFDVERGEWHEVARNRTAVVLEGALRVAIAAEVRATTSYRLPGGRRAWRDGNQLCIEQPDGSVRALAWPDRLGRFARPRGHGLAALGSYDEYYDLQRERIVPAPKGAVDAWQVRREWLVAVPRGKWHRLDAEDGTLESRDELAGASCDGAVDDDRLLFSRAHGKRAPTEWFVYRPATRGIEPVVDDGDDPRRAWVSAGLPADARGRCWLARGADNSTELRYLALDPATLRVTALPVAAGRVFALLGDDVFTVEDGRRIARTNYATGARTVLYPARER